MEIKVPTTEKPYEKPTGEWRGAPHEWIDLADTASEVKTVKHAFEAGVPAQRGNEH
jgi:ATP:corrinoid adenosyltransferase